MGHWNLALAARERAVGRRCRFLAKLSWDVAVSGVSCLFCHADCTHSQKQADRGLIGNGHRAGRRASQSGEPQGSYRRIPGNGSRRVQWAIGSEANDFDWILTSCLSGGGRFQDSLSAGKRMLGPLAPSPARNVTPWLFRTRWTESATFTLTLTDPASSLLKDARLISASRATSSGLNPKPMRAAFKNRPDGNIRSKKHKKCSKSSMSTICQI